MKNKSKVLTYLFLIITSLFSWINQVYGQEKLNISTGFGLPELLNIGMRYQIDQTQIGLSVGSLPLGSNESVVSISGDFYYHFGGFSELSNRRPWFGRIGLNYLRDETESIIHKDFYLNTRIGRDFNISKKIGIEIGIGAIFILSDKEINKNTSNSAGTWTGGWTFDLDFPVLPSLGIGLFYRI
ncbi:hypothetical protein [Algoriphagus halophilus]|uniref:Outer membrane protein beta-barrel domain-containing protein n=1 Tax=Algoriphagus halophilus TaxID=226505 RepID=A0A1N6D3V6_9BACT|nr:hypothetical protein [Algoriphagus halophilus]SIN65344.1 hypothetical protein SAMN05444394_0121 [Algoriphagus halophilus]